MPIILSYKKNLNLPVISTLWKWLGSLDKICFAVFLFIWDMPDINWVTTARSIWDKKGRFPAYDNFRPVTLSVSSGGC